MPFRVLLANVKPPPLLFSFSIVNRNHLLFVDNSFNVSRHISDKYSKNLT